MDLVLNTSQKLAISQRMLQSAEILQMSSQELIEYVKELSIENPVVEYEEKKEEESKYDLLKRKLEWLDAADEQNKTYYRYDRADEDENDMWKFKDNVDENLEEYLISQVNVLPLERRKLAVAHYIIESIDSNGYIDDTVEDMATRLNVDKNIVNEMLQLIQTFEPAGVGAKNLKECLMLQIKRSNIKNPLAERIIENELETLGKNQLHIIARRLKAPMEDVICACDIIKSLNPKPGNSFVSEKNLEYITPDVIIVKDNDEYEIVLNDYFFPKIRINGYYKNIMRNETSDNTKEYVCDKIRQAEWAMKCISKRNTTLVKTLGVIIELQKGFFDNGPGNLRPMKLLDVAERIEMHESTVSRAIRDKYLQCSWGVFSLSEFFSTGVGSSDDDRKLTPDNIKSIIKEIIDNEDKQSPLSDREITEELNKRKISISRRTVAKYRESIGILGTTGRKGY